MPLDLGGAPWWALALAVLLALTALFLTWRLRQKPSTRRRSGITAFARTAQPHSTACRPAGAAATGGCSPTPGWTRALYAAGRLDRTLPFPELRRIAYLNDIANRAPDERFGDYIRRELERRRHER